MMARIRRFESWTGDDPAEYVSASPDSDAYHLRMIVGPLEGPGEESFDVLVCTPVWLANQVQRHGPQVGRHHLIVEYLDTTKAMDFLRERVEHRISGLDWNEVAEKVARLGYWEFEDYQA